MSGLPEGSLGDARGDDRRGKMTKKDVIFLSIIKELNKKNMQGVTRLYDCGSECLIVSWRGSRWHSQWFKKYKCPYREENNETTQMA